MDIDYKVTLIQKLARGFMSRKKYKYKQIKQLNIQKNGINLGTCLLEYDPFGLILDIEYTKARPNETLEEFFVFRKPVLEPKVEFCIGLGNKVTGKDFEGNEKISDDKCEQLIQDDAEIFVEDTWSVQVQAKVVVNIETCTILQFSYRCCKDGAFEEKLPSRSRSGSMNSGKFDGSLSDSGKIVEQAAELESKVEEFKGTEENLDENERNFNISLADSIQKTGTNELEGTKFSEFIVKSELVIEKVNDSVKNNSNKIKLPSLAESNKLESLETKKNSEGFLSSPLLKKIPSQVLPELNHSGRYTKMQIKEDALEDTQKLPKLKSLSSLPKKKTLNKALKKHHKNLSQTKQQCFESLNSTSNIKDLSFANPIIEKEKFSKTFVNYQSNGRLETSSYGLFNETFEKSDCKSTNNMLSNTNIEFFPQNFEIFSSEKKLSAPKKRFSDLASNPSFVPDSIQKFRTQALNSDQTSPYKVPTNPIPPPISFPKLKRKKLHRQKIKNLLKKK